MSAPVSGPVADSADWTALREGLSKAWFIWGAMLGSVVLYLVVVTMLAERVTHIAGRGVVSEPLAYLLYGLAAAACIGAAVVRKTMLRGPVLMSHAGVTARTYAHNLVRRYLAALTISLALCEVVALLGLVFYLVDGDHERFFVLTMFSAIAMIVFRPSSDEIERLGDRFRSLQPPSP